MGGELSLVALNFESSSTTVADLIGDQLPANSKIHLWNGTGYSTSIKNSRSGWSAGTINRGDAFWIESAASAGTTNEIIVSGEVLPMRQIRQRLLRALILLDIHSLLRLHLVIPI